MKFDVNVPGPIVSAKLVVHNSGTTWNRDVGIYSMTDTTWDENSVTWNSRPLIDGVLLDRKDVRNETWEEFDVSSGVVSNGLVSFGLLRDPLDTQRHLDSRESLYPPELRIEYRATLSPADHYADWRTGYDFDGKIDFLDDPDGDVHNNLVEYGLGGSPDDANDPSDMLPTVRHVVTGGVEGLDYVYRRRTDAAMRGLSYRIEECSDLRSAEWIAATFPELDTSPLEAGFETVTHRIPVSRTNGFFRLRIAIE